jgi:hypothetical protein
VGLFEPVFSALNEAAARYVVVGGVATVLHGFPRLTADLDLIVDLAPAEALKTIRALTALGLQPRTPVPAEDFADPAIRTEWIEKDKMRVFSLWDPQTPLREVDIVAQVPLPFEELWLRSELVQLSSTSVRVASIADLIFIKSVAGRPQDRQDIEALQEIQKVRSAGHH